MKDGPNAQRSLMYVSVSRGESSKRTEPMTEVHGSQT